MATTNLFPDRSLWVVRDGDEVVGAATRTPPYNLVLARPRDDTVLDALVAAIDDVPGVVGAVPEVDAFVERWCAARGAAPRPVFDQGVYELRVLRELPRANGAMRTATTDDLALVLDWWGAFAREALHEGEPGTEGYEPHVRGRLESDNSGFGLWEDDGNVVSLCGWGGPTPNGIRIGPVYTPPELRGRGYGTTLTADVSARLLAAGRSFCFLYTDLANPTSNAIYERIGYERVCDSRQIAFE